MFYRLTADLVVIVHLAFIAFVVLGGLLALRDRRWAWVHLPAVAWAVYVEMSGSICPLTPLEYSLREAAGERGYQGDFIDHYLLPIIYPAGLTPNTQILLGVILITLNVALYAVAWRRSRLR